MEDNKQTNNELFMNKYFLNFVLLYSSIVTPLTLVFFEKNFTIGSIENGIEIILLMILLFKLKQSGNLELEESIQLTILIFYLFNQIDINYTESSKSNSFTIAGWFRLIRTIILIRKLFERSSGYNNSRNKYIFLYILSTAIVLNNLTCIWIGIGQVKRYSKNWINYYNFDKVSGFDLYIASLYYNVNTLLTIGYGDIRSTNILEIIYNIVLMIGLVITLPLMINKIYNIISFNNNFLKEENNTNEKIRFLDNLSKKYAIPSKFYNELKNYLILKKKPNSDFTEILEFLPYNYKKKLVDYVYLKDGINLQKNNFLKNRSKEFLINFLPIMEISRFTGNHIIGSIGNLCEEIYVVLNGELSVISTQGIELLSVPENRFIGMKHNKGNIIFDVKVKESARVIILRKFSKELLKYHHSKEMKEILDYCNNLYQFLIEANKYVVYISENHGIKRVPDFIEKLYNRLSGKEEKFPKALKRIINNYRKEEIQEIFDSYKDDLANKTRLKT